MKTLLRTLPILLLLISAWARGAGTFVQTPYPPAKAVFDVYLADPHEIDSALYWVRSLFNTLTQAPYNYAPEDLHIVVILHGTEIVTVAQKNETKYREAVERMRYYADLGVKFLVCGQAAEDYGYSVRDFQNFIEVVPNAIAELAYWQQRGYALITPRIYEKRLSIEQIR